MKNTFTLVIFHLNEIPKLLNGFPISSVGTYTVSIHMYPSYICAHLLSSFYCSSWVLESLFLFSICDGYSGIRVYVRVQTKLFPLIVSLEPRSNWKWKWTSFQFQYIIYSFRFETNVIYKEIYTFTLGMQILHTAVEIGSIFRLPL